MSLSIEDKIKIIMGDILELEAGAINDDTSMENIELWDSSNHLSIIMALEEEFSISLEIDEIESMFTFYDIVSVIQEKI